MIAMCGLPEEYWLWQGDGEDYLESLTCPVLIKAEQLHKMQQELAQYKRAFVLAITDATPERVVAARSAPVMLGREYLNQAKQQLSTELVAKLLCKQGGTDGSNSTSTPSR